MEWTSITTAISLGVIAICGIVITFIYWRRGRAAQALPVVQTESSTWNRVERAMTWVSFVLLIVLIGVLTISPKALAVIEPKEGVSIDFSLLATIFGILVTLLVTWQIWQSIDTKDSLEYVARLRGEFDSMRSLMNMQHMIHEAFMLDIRAENNRLSGRTSMAFDFFTQSAFLFLRDIEHYELRIMAAIASMQTCVDDLSREFPNVARNTEINQFRLRRENIERNLDELLRQVQNLTRFSTQAITEINRIRKTIDTTLQQSPTTE